MDGNVKDTPPTVFVPGRRDRRRWEALGGRADRAPAASSTPARSRPGPSSTGGSAAAEARRRWPRSVPAEGLRLAGQRCRPATADAGRPSARFEIGRRGRLREGPGVLLGAWVKLPEAGMTGAVVARMDDRDGYRGWDLWLEKEPRRDPHRPQVARRRAQGRRATPRSRRTLDPRAGHLRRLGQGRRGEDLYQRRAAGDRRRGRHPARTRSAPTVPLKVGQRHTGARLDGRGDPRTCGSTTGALPPTRSTGSPGPTGPRAWSRTPAGQAAERRARRGLRLVAAVDRSGRQGARAPSWRRSRRRRRRSRRGARSRT